MAESLLNSNFDIIFMILSLLPTETLLQVQTVCRAWAWVISDPDFVRAHCSLPARITAFFTRRGGWLTCTQQWFKPYQEDVKFPSSISDNLSIGFEVASSNHGILCFQRNMIFFVGNPATSSWFLVRCAPPNFSSYKYHGGVALIYDPAISLNFKLTLALIKLDNSDKTKYWIQFHIYSSETCSWTISSEFSQRLNPMFDQFDKGQWESVQYIPCKIGGGSVCWGDHFGLLVGYEISTDTYWKTSLPPPFKQRGSNSMSCYNNIIYFTRMAYGVAKVWRLEGKDSWAEIMDVVRSLHLSPPVRSTLRTNIVPLVSLCTASPSLEEMREDLHTIG
ncbi:F-box protein [Carex littledalei]|uniref:F-box protein n=1 Tax=Carex littledalei TaxID=544730 RepID=A0A833VH07_9POAL|nr:F-box protein [Carex littledalei]